MNTCGQCKFGKPVPNELGKRFCFGAPPAPIAMPVRQPTGMQIGVQMIRPVVDVKEEACSLFQQRIIASAAVDLQVKSGNGR